MTPLYAVVDIETSGPRPNRDKIIEIAVILHDGTTIVDSFSSLVNPHTTVPHFITQITGITNDMLVDAPEFCQIARQIVEMTEGAIFVAHNLRFDYSFIRKAYWELGYNYRRNTLCTLRLSRALLPDQPSYSLGKLCANLDIPVHARHRAHGDAEATAHLLTLLLATDKAKVTESIIDEEIRLSRLPPKLDPNVLAELPDEAGVYYFLNQSGQALYVGKSRNIRRRIVEHLRLGQDSSKSVGFFNEIADIDFELTGSELIALLREAEEIKRLRPEHNRSQRRVRYRYGLVEGISDHGIRTLAILPVKNDTNALMPISNRHAGKKLLDRLADKHRLCQQHISAYHSSFERSPIKREAACSCQGFCSGSIPLEQYNNRVQKVIKTYTYPHDHCLIIDDGRHADEVSLVLIRDGSYCGFSFVDRSLQIGSAYDLHDLIPLKEETKDIRQILLRAIRRGKPKVMKVVDLQEESDTHWLSE